MGKRIVLYVPDGVGIRNYLYSKVFKERPADLILYHNFDPATLSMLKDSIQFESTHEAPPFKEGIKEKYLRELIHCSRLRYHARRCDNPTLLSSWNRPKKGAKNKLFYKTIDLVSYNYKSYDSILGLEKQYDAIIRATDLYKAAKQELKKLNADTLFCTHQRALKAPAVYAAARDLGIKTVAVIYSWDNIPKARLALKADKYLVWSDFMKQQLQEFYPELSEDQIEVTGTPQFDFYSEEQRWKSRQEFGAELGLDLNKKWICFSGDDVMTSPYDPHYLEDMASAMKEAGLEKEYQVVFRRCPVDVSGRYDKIVAKHSDLIVSAPPKWNIDRDVWSSIYPTDEDTSVLVNLAKHCELVVNVGSTMAFDFGMFHKPCAFINYDQPHSTNWSVDTVYKYQHFRSMPDERAVLWWNKPEEIAGLISNLDSNKTTIRTWMEKIIGSDQASDRVYNAL